MVSICGLRIPRIPPKDRALENFEKSNKPFESKPTTEIRICFPQSKCFFLCVEKFNNTFSVCFWELGINNFFPERVEIEHS